MSSTRHIAIIAPPWYPLPPRGYGGTELVVHLLVQSLRRLGVRVTVFGCEGSAPGTTMLSPERWADDLGKVWFIQSHREQEYHARVLEHLSRLDDVDVIHDNAEGTSLVAAATYGAAPVVHTVHGPMIESRAGVYRALGGRARLVAISDHLRGTAPTLNWVGTVHNAVDIDNLRVAGRDEKEGYLLCLGRVGTEKGQHLAIEAARRAGRRLIMAGKVGEPEHEQRYFRDRIEPHIDGDRVVYVGNVMGAAKTELIARASALIHPVEWPEPFGLALVEAMASGTPCVAIGLGAVPELVIDGETGFAAADVDGLVNAIGRLPEIDNIACAAAARARFHPDVMAKAYMEVYERVIAGESEPAPPAPVIDLTGAVTRRESHAPAPGVITADSVGDRADAAQF